MIRRKGFDEFVILLALYGILRGLQFPFIGAAVCAIVLVISVLLIEKIFVEDV